jgi:hypothetical protein
MRRLYGVDKVKHVCCWAHSRRKFVAAGDGGDERGKQALELIRQLYAIERELPPLLPPADNPVEQQQRQRSSGRRRRRPRRGSKRSRGLAETASRV